MIPPTHITIRMTPEFKEMAKAKADKYAMNLSTYIKYLINENEPTKAQNRAQEKESDY